MEFNMRAIASVQIFASQAQLLTNGYDLLNKDKSERYVLAMAS